MKKTNTVIPESSSGQALSTRNFTFKNFNNKISTREDPVGFKAKVRYPMNKHYIKVAFLLISLLSLSGLFYPLHPDEQVFMTIGQEIEQGSILYRDVFDNKPPGIHIIYYLINLFVYWGDESTKLHFVRISIIFANLITAYLIYLIGEKLRNRPTRRHSGAKTSSQSCRSDRILCNFPNNPAFISTISYLVLLHFYQGQFFLTEPFMIMWLLAGTFFVLNGSRIQSGTIRSRNSDRKDRELPNREVPGPSLLKAGLCLGMAMLFKQVAVVNVIAVGAFIVISNTLIAREESSSFYGSPSGFLVFLRSTRNDIALITIGILLPWIPVLIYFYTNSALQGLWYALITYNLFEYPPYSFLETLEQLPIILWPLIAWIGMLLLSRIVHTNKSSLTYYLPPNTYNRLPTTYSIQLITLFILLPLPLILTRPYHHYWLQILPFIILLITDKMFSITSLSE